MSSVSIALEGSGRHWLEVVQEQAGWHLRLARNRSDRRCPLHAAFQQHLRVVQNGRSLPLQNGELRLLVRPSGSKSCVLEPHPRPLSSEERGDYGDPYVVQQRQSSPSPGGKGAGGLGPTNHYWHDCLFEGGDIAVWLGEVGPLAQVRLPAGEAAAVVLTVSPLTSFETRYLAENQRPFPTGSADIPSDPGLQTDLHTHFAGCVRPDDLLRIGLEQGIRYPATLLAEAGIHVGDGKLLPLEALPERHRNLLAEQLSIPADRQITFLELERIYRLRSPVTRSLTAFLPLCRQIATDYAEMGVQYAELSLGGIVEAERLQLAHAELPSIERESGVTLRFLAAMSRHDDPEWDEDYLERLQEVADSRYIAGVDFMGHETNSTRDFGRQLRAVAAWAGKRRPGFVVRIHAGENPAYPENVRVALECIGDARVTPRIGHGLYGVDPATRTALRERGAVVEFNLSSNFALNNLQSLGRAPLREYLAEGLRVVLGTDGYGIYQTTSAVEARLARLAGITEEDLAAIRRHEAEYLTARATAEASTPPPHAFRVPPDSPPRYYTPEVAARRAEAVRTRDEKLTDRLAELDVALLEEAGVNALLRNRLSLSLSGAWKNSWEAITPAQQARIREVLEELLSALEPAETVLITGGTRYGVEGLAQSLAKARGFPVLATLVNETPPESLEPGGFTHAYLVGERLYDKAAGLYALLRRHNGFCLFLGGGPIVNDEIQAAANLRLRYLLMDGPEGASTEHAREQPHRAFRTVKEVLAVLHGEEPWSSDEPPYWHLGANPTVDMVLLRQNPASGEEEVLLIQRDPDAPTEPGKWALPGGFVHTEAPPGTPWKSGAETEREACLRELWEETGLDLRGREADLLPVGEYEGGGRDPRDTAERWSRAVVFALRLPEEHGEVLLAGGDDARDARWLSLSAVPADLAFDHERLLRDALAVLRGADSAATT